MADALVLPKKPSEYVHEDYNLVDSGYRWVFGLPSEGQLSSPTCGAMPFRKGTGLCSPNCIRGEDWVFMQNWCHDRAMMPSWIVFNDWSSWDGTRYIIDKAPTTEQLSNMYGNLCGLSTVWGSNFTIEDQVTTYEGAESILRNGLQPITGLVSQPPPAAGDVALLGSRIANFFADMAKYKCTIAQASHDPPGHHMQKELYSWSEDYDGDLYEQANYLSSLNLPNYYYVPNPPDYRPIQIEAQFIGLFYCYTGDSEHGTLDEGYALCKLGDKVTLTQNQDRNAEHQFSIDTHYGGAGLAGKVASVLGIKFPPTRPKDERAWATMVIKYLYAVVWPKYLTY